MNKTEKERKWSQCHTGDNKEFNRADYTGLVRANKLKTNLNLIIVKRNKNK